MGKFKPGQSGNPAGRRKGVQDRRVQARELFAAHRDELIAKAIELALAGDTSALRMCLDRVSPPIRAIDQCIQLRSHPAPLDAQGAVVLQQLAAGELPPSVAVSVLSAIAQQVRIVSETALEHRLSALEARLDAKP